MNFGGNMQLSFVTQAVRNAGSSAAAGASTAAQWGCRTVSAMMSNVATYAANAATLASKFFSSCMTKTAAFCVAQPYVAATMGILSVALIAFIAGRRFAHP